MAIERAQSLKPDEDCTKVAPESAAPSILSPVSISRKQGQQPRAARSLNRPRRHQ